MKRLVRQLLQVIIFVILVCVTAVVGSVPPIHWTPGPNATAGGGGGCEQFDQFLNTTSDVRFNSVNVTEAVTFSDGLNITDNGTHGIIFGRIFIEKP
jgi:hypothetical protein